MLAVVIVAFAIGLLPRHVMSVIHDEGNFAPRVLANQAGFLILYLALVVALALRARALRKHQTHAANLRGRVPIKEGDPTHAEKSQPNHL